METQGRLFKALLVVISLALLSGCAHQIQINPDMTKLRQSQAITLIDKNVAYYISEQNRLKEVTTPGGGGDKVKYKPYADSEGAINTVLSNVFSRVYSVNSLNDKAFIKQKDISLIFIPEIITSSSSSSLLTWPPTAFTMKLSCKALDNSGKTIWIKTIKSKGEAEFSEFKNDFSLAARRASETVFLSMLDELANAESTFK